MRWPNGRFKSRKSVQEAIARENQKELDQENWRLKRLYFLHDTALQINDGIRHLILGAMHSTDSTAQDIATELDVDVAEVSRILNILNDEFLVYQSTPTTWGKMHGN